MPQNMFQIKFNKELVLNGTLRYYRKKLKNIYN